MPDNESGKDRGKLQERDLDGFGFRVGYRTELDLKFRKAILETIPAGKGITVYIKEIIVEWDEMKRTRAMDNIKVDPDTLAIWDNKIEKLTSLELRLTDLERRILAGQVTPELRNEVVNDSEISEEVKAKIEDLINDF